MPKPENFCETCRHFDQEPCINYGGKEICLELEGKGLCRLRPTTAGQESVTTWASTAFAVVLASDGCSEWQIIVPDP